MSIVESLVTFVILAFAIYGVVSLMHDLRSHLDRRG